MAVALFLLAGIPVAILVGSAVGLVLDKLLSWLEL